MDTDRQNVETFFKSSEAPANISEERSLLEEFLKIHHDRNIVCVTSGGTTVPLEKNTVRFIDNFSTGKRGAACCEHLLEMGYSVVYLCRDGAAAPFARSFQAQVGKNIDLGFLENLQVNDNGSVEMIGSGLKEILEEYKSLKSRLLPLSFTSLPEYLHKLRMCAEALKPAGKRAMFMFAAAVSDFYVPAEKLVKHKIQSRDGPLTLELDQVPKTLGVLRNEWAPHAFFVSFKLETDHDILIKKAKQAIEKYKMDLVVANELHTRYIQLYLVTHDSEVIVRASSEHEEIEIPMIKAVCEEHKKFLTH